MGVGRSAMHALSVCGVCVCVRGRGRGKGREGRGEGEGEGKRKGMWGSGACSMCGVGSVG